MSETVTFGDFTIDLDTPTCEIAACGGDQEATYMLMIHGCKQFLACEPCVTARFAELIQAFRQYESMVCGECRVEFLHYGEYAQSVEI